MKEFNSATDSTQPGEKKTWIAPDFNVLDTVKAGVNTSSFEGNFKISTSAVAFNKYDVS